MALPTLYHGKYQSHLACMTAKMLTIWNRLNYDYKYYIFRIEECKVSLADESREIFPIHSFGKNADGDAETCFDQTRLKVSQTTFAPNATWEMRTFKFNTDGGSPDKQLQTVDCLIHLDPIAELSEDQRDDCQCYTESQCSKYTRIHVVSYSS